MNALKKLGIFVTGYFFGIFTVIGLIWLGVAALEVVFRG